MEERARKAYKKQIDFFTVRMLDDIRKYPNIDYNTKRNIKLQAMRLKWECLDNYRSSLEDIETETSIRGHIVNRNVYTDKVTSYVTKNIYIELYEQDMAERFDSVINKIDLLNDDNKDQLIYFSDNLNPSNLYWQLAKSHDFKPSLPRKVPYPQCTRSTTSTSQPTPSTSARGAGNQESQFNPYSPLPAENRQNSANSQYNEENLPNFNIRGGYLDYTPQTWHRWL